MDICKNKIFIELNLLYKSLVDIYKKRQFSRIKFLNILRIKISNFIHIIIKNKNYNKDRYGYFLKMFNNGKLKKFYKVKQFDNVYKFILKHNNDFEKDEEDKILENDMYYIDYDSKQLLCEIIEESEKDLQIFIKNKLKDKYKYSISS